MGVRLAGRAQAGCRRARLNRVAALLAVALAGCATVAPEPGPRIAITVDDLPVHGPHPISATPIEANLQMIASLRAAGIPGVHAFVNGAPVEGEPETMAALEAWSQAGIPLANHGWAHRNLNDISPKDFEQEVARNEPLLKRFGPAEDWRWFRFPFLAEGDDLTKRLAARSVLARRGYRIAGVSMDFSDWKWTAPFARCADLGDVKGIAELERTYLEAASASLRAKRKLARDLYGRDIPHVLLLHVSAFSARMMPRLLDLYRRTGVRFVSLAEAQADGAYAEEMDPRLPPRPQFIADRAPERGVAVPWEPDFTTRLESICR